MADQDERKRQEAEASRRWRENHHERYKQIARDAYHRRQAKFGKPKAVRYATDAERNVARRESARRWQLKNKDKVAAIAKASYDRNREKQCARSRDWYQRNKARVIERATWANIKRRYGLTKEQYEALGTKCAICGVERDMREGYRLAVDHCHDTGKVRGLLCGNCNTAIGLFRNDPELMKTAIAYLRTTT